MANIAQQTIGQLLDVFGADELRALIDAQTAQRVADDQRRAAELAALVEDQAAADRRAADERRKAAGVARRNLEAAQRRAVDAHAAALAARAAFLASAAETNAAVEAHRVASDELGAVADRPAGEAWGWERPAPRWSERDGVTLAQLQRAR